ncbi:uncharacterized protein [Argopecten irradians]|uniref:uncharacterized protein n=1 Tax=Argopecten irradians TaxID=31199 RepID=UPI00371B78A5
MQLRPSEIRFSQDSINNVFDKRSPHAHRRIGETLDALLKDQCTIYQIPTITVVKRNEVWYSADNRRLWVFRKLEELGKCTTIPVREGYSIPSEKFTTRNSGRFINVRRDAGGSYWRTYRHNSSQTWTRPASTSGYGTQSLTNPSSYGTQSLTNPSSYGTQSLTNPSSYGTQSLTNPSSYGTPGLISLFHSQRSTTSSLVSGLGYNRDEALYGRPSTTGASLDTYIRGLKHPRPEFSSRPTSAYAVPSYSRSSSIDSDVKLLDPDDVRYTKETIKRPSFGFVYERASPILVYRAFDENWALDGNRRLWSAKQARQYDLTHKIKAVLKDDEDEFLEKMRVDRPWLTLLDIIQMGETVKVE